MSFDMQSWFVLLLWDSQTDESLDLYSARIRYVIVCTQSSLSNRHYYQAAYPALGDLIMTLLWRGLVIIIWARLILALIRVDVRHVNPSSWHPLFNCLDCLTTRVLGKCVESKMSTNNGFALLPPRSSCELCGSDEARE